MTKRPNSGRFFVAILSCFLCFLFLDRLAAQEISKTTICEIPVVEESSLIGMRVFEGRALLLWRCGELFEIDLETGVLTRSDTGYRNLLDFGILNGLIVPLQADLGGIQAGLKEVPRGMGYEAAAVECGFDGSVFLLNANGTRYFPVDSSRSHQLDGLFFLMPLENGFAWVLQRDASSGKWTANIHDYFGNHMHDVYRFSKQFKPSGLSLGPVGPEGELLVSYQHEGKRGLLLIGQNSRMIWRIPGPASQSSRRDIAWDAKGNLIVVERENGRLVLKRWEFELPQG